MPSAVTLLDPPELEDTKVIMRVLSAHARTGIRLRFMNSGS